jgi:CTP-dependent riboflavin kinase
MSNFNEKVLNYIETTGKAIKVALDLVQQEKAASAEEQNVATAVEKLEQAGLIDSHESKQASAQLANPNEALDILANVIEHYSSQLKDANAKVASATIGEGVGETATPQTEKYANYVGRRRGSDEGPSASDQALLSLIDGYNPGHSI